MVVFCEYLSGAAVKAGNRPGELAQDLNVRTLTLYSHITGIDDLKRTKHTAGVRT